MTFRGDSTVTRTPPLPSGAQITYAADCDRAVRYTAACLASRFAACHHAHTRASSSAFAVRIPSACSRSTMLSTATPHRFVRANRWNRMNASACCDGPDGRSWSPT
jgi:hypothetical protein